MISTLRASPSSLVGLEAKHRIDDIRPAMEIRPNNAPLLRKVPAAESVEKKRAHIAVGRGKKGDEKGREDGEGRGRGGREGGRRSEAAVV
mmetsp:Transcript_26149/g.63034  ORF Transcript_26149/g.63034 Transcript_26149/m.63034 type:complete len:90 (+) Transcript_26149:509-778(+)